VSSVEIDHAKLTTAVDKLQTLRTSLDTQKQNALNGTPIALPALSAPAFTQKLQWLEDQEPMLRGLADIAFLLDSDGDGTSNFDVGDTTADVKTLLGQTMAEQARRVSPHDEEFSDRFLTIMESWSEDGTVTTEFLDTLGPEGALQVTSQWGQEKDNHVSTEPTDTQRRLLELMQTSLETASNHWSDAEASTFAEGMVEAATVDPDEIYGRGAYNPSGALSYLLYDGRFGDAFLTSMGDGLDAYERVDNSGASGLWGNRPDMGIDFSQYLPWGAASGYRNLDPMTSLMSSLENSPAVALDFFSGGEDVDGVSRSEYYIKERNWDQDAYESLTGALDVATTNSDLISDPNSATARQAAQLASETVHYLSGRENYDEIADMITRSPDNGASESLAHIMSTYMVGVDAALNANQGGSNDPGVSNVYMDAFNAKVGNAPLFDEDSLQKFSLLAMASDDGFAQVRTGLTEYRAEKLGALADAVDQHDNHSTRNQLQTGITQDGAMEGFFINTLGDDRIAEGAAKDARIEAWVDGAASVVDLVPVPGMSKLGEGVAADVVNLTIDSAKGSGTDAIKSALATHEDSARSEANDLATETLRSQTFAVAQLLDDRGLAKNPDGMSEAARPGGSLLSWDEFSDLSDAEQLEVLSEVYSSDIGVGDYFDGQGYEEAYRSQFTDYFEAAQS